MKRKGKKRRKKKKKKMFISSSNSTQDTPPLERMDKMLKPSPIEGEKIFKKAGKKKRKKLVKKLDPELRNLKTIKKIDKHYEMLEEIGVGSFGSVHRARRLTDQKIVAIKITNTDVTPEDALNIAKEINTLIEVDGEHVARYYDSFLHNNRVYIVMEYCEGGSLQEILFVRETPFLEDQIAAIVKDLLLCLKQLHDKKIIHRDIKSGNILLSKEGKLKLADFGLSTQLNHSFSQRKSFVGSPHWMSPESIMAQEGNTHSFPSDIWSLGITIIELAQLFPPTSNLGPMKALLQIPNLDPPKLKEEENWSDTFKDFLSRCLQKKETDRMTIDELMEHDFITGNKFESKTVIATLTLEVQKEYKEYGGRKGYYNYRRRKAMRNKRSKNTDTYGYQMDTGYGIPGKDTWSDAVSEDESEDTDGSGSDFTDDLTDSDENGSFNSMRPIGKGDGDDDECSFDSMKLIIESENVEKEKKRKENEKVLACFTEMDVPTLEQALAKVREELKRLERDLEIGEIVLKKKIANWNP